MQLRSIYIDEVEVGGSHHQTALCAVCCGWGPDTWGTEGKSVSLALDHIQPPTDLHRALMTKQFSRPKVLLVNTIRL